MNKLLSHTLFMVTVAVLTLSACSKHDLNLGNLLIDDSVMLDKDKFIEQSGVRSKRDAGYGPQVDTSKDESLREETRTHINTEEPPDYDKLESKANTQNVFPVDVNVENMDIRTFTSMLSEITGVNFLISDEVNSTISARVENVGWSQMLDSILKMKTLAKHVDHDANIVRIHDYNTVMEIEDFERKRHENMQKALLLERAKEPIHTEVFKLFYTRPLEVKEILDSALKSSISTGGNSGIRNTDPDITIDERRNILIVKARKEDLEIMGKLIREIDSRTSQVFIEAFIVEVTDDFEQALGTRLGLTGADTYTAHDNKSANASVAGTAGTSGGLTIGDNASSVVELLPGSPFAGIGFATGLGSVADLKVELAAMEAEGLTKVISNPKIFTLDNQEATIFQGDEVPYETVSQEGTKVEFKEAGLKLAVLPTVIGDGNLLMDITVNKDTVDTSQTNPPIRKSEIKTSLVSKDGAIVVIGGIYDENKTDAADKVPGLGDVPLLGKLFRRDTTVDNRRELMVFIAPRVL